MLFDANAVDKVWFVYMFVVWWWFFSSSECVCMRAEVVY